MKSSQDMAKKQGASGEGKGQAQPLPKWAPWLFWPALLVAFFFIAFLMPVLYWYNAGSVQAQYYQYYTAFGKDAIGLESMAARYDSISMGNMTFGAKARAANSYAQKASQVLTTWNYTRSFMLQSKGMLDAMGISAAGAVAGIEANTFVVKGNAGRMSRELEAFAAGDPQKESAIGATLDELRKVK